MDTPTDRLKRIRFTIAVVAPIALFQIVRIAHSHRGLTPIELFGTVVTCVVFAVIVWRYVRQQPQAPALTHPFVISIGVIVAILIVIELFAGRR